MELSEVVDEVLVCGMPNIGVLVPEGGSDSAKLLLLMDSRSVVIGC